MTTPSIPQPVRGHLGATDVGPRNLELDRQTFNLPTFQDISLNQWMAVSPAELVQVHLNLDETAMKALRRGTQTVVR